jgi:AraC family transcriptional regulator, transcriptional activator of pobA
MSDPLPFFFIYGEPSREVDLRFAHVERVSDRFALHGGHVLPHRHVHLHQISLWRNGKGVYALDGEQRVLPPNALTIVPAGTVHGFDIGEGCDAIVISISDGFIQDCVFGPNRGIADCMRVHALLEVPRDMADELTHLFERLEEEYRRPAWAQVEAIAAYIRMIIILAGRLREAGSLQQEYFVKSPLLVRFHALVEQHFRERVPLSAYVDLLGTTRYLLNTAVKTGHGICASSLIQRRVMTEAKRLLLYTALPVSQISATLGFDDATHFARNFRRHAGEPPTIWRERQLAGDALERTQQTGCTQIAMVGSG